MPFVPKRRLRLRGLGPFEALESAESLVDYLNSRQGVPKFEEVEWMAVAMNRLDRLVGNTGYALGTYSKIRKGKFGKEAQQLTRIIDGLVREYPISVGLGAPWPNGWRRLYTYFPHAYGRRSGIDRTYLGKVFILDAAFQGFLRRIAQCPSCRKWFVIKRVDQKFCSAKCREKAFRTTDEGKAKRAAYMRSYRETLRRMTSGSIRAAKKEKN